MLSAVSTQSVLGRCESEHGGLTPAKPDGLVQSERRLSGRARGEIESPQSAFPCELGHVLQQESCDPASAGGFVDDDVFHVSAQPGEGRGGDKCGGADNVPLVPHHQEVGRVMCNDSLDSGAVESGGSGELLQERGESLGVGVREVVQ